MTAGTPTGADPVSLIVAPTLSEIDPATDPGPKPEFCWLPKAWLHVDERYQRGATGERSRRLIRSIAEGFLWAKFSPVTVTPEADRFLVIDGQHRTLAALLVPAVVEIPCWIIAEQDLRQQARTFTGINADRLAVQPLQLFKAQLAAGDPDALQVDKVCRDAGVEIAYTLPGGSGRLPPRQTQAIATIRKLIAAHGEWLAVAALKTLADAYPERSNQMRGQIIAAVATLALQYGKRLDRDRLVRVLAANDCELLLDQARTFKDLAGGKTQGALVMALVAAYDRGLAPERRLNPQEKAA